MYAVLRALKSYECLRYHAFIILNYALVNTGWKQPCAFIFGRWQFEYLYFRTAMVKWWFTLVYGVLGLGLGVPCMIRHKLKEVNP